MADITELFSGSMEERQSGRNEQLDVTTLQLKLNKALADADYWRLAYDKLIKHIDNQETYVRNLEQQLWGSR